MLDDSGACAENRLTDAEFNRLEQLAKILSPLKEKSDRLHGLEVKSTLLEALLCMLFESWKATWLAL